MMVQLPRYVSVNMPLGEDLWELLVGIDDEKVDKLLGNLEVAVSNGFFGLAAEISDQLRARAEIFLATVPSRRVRLEIEHMKRLSYMGYKEPALEAAGRALDEIRHWRSQLPSQAASVWEFEAIGYRAWLEHDAGALEGILRRSESLIADLGEADSFRGILTGFLEGMRGRLCALQDDRLGTEAAFERGIKILRDSSARRSLAHLQVLFAEHLALLGDWEGVLRVADNFFDEALGFGLRSHLLLRMVLLLLHSPDEFASEQRKRQLRFRCLVLVYAMGVSQSSTIFPLLAQAKISMENSLGWSLLDIHLEAEVERWLRALTPSQMERVLLAYYQYLGYEAWLMPEHEPVLDVLALRKYEGGVQHCIGIQVKHLSANTLYKNDVPDEVSFRQLKERLRERVPHCLPNSLHWHCTSGIHTHARSLLEERVHSCFGDSCEVFYTDLTDLVRLLTQHPESLRVIFSVEISAGFPSMGDSV